MLFLGMSGKGVQEREARKGIQCLEMLEEGCQERDTGPEDTRIRMWSLEMEGERW